MAYAGLITAVERTLADTKLTVKYLYTPEFKFITEPYALCWVRMKSFLGHRIKYGPEPNT